MFTHLHTHSYYSFLEGLISPAELVQAAAREGMPALALTDHLWLTGAVEFYEACLEAGIRPILGLELEVSHPGGMEDFLRSDVPDFGPLVLLATDVHGWASICRLSSAVLADPDSGRTGSLDFERFAQDTQGLVCLTGGQRGLLDRLAREIQDRAARRWLERLYELFSDRLYLELSSRYGEATNLLGRLDSLGRSLNIPRVTTHNVYYLTPEQAELQRLAAAMRLNQPLADLRGEDLPPSGGHFASIAEMETHFKEVPDAIAATQEVSERCQLELPLDVPHFPELSMPAGESVMEVLRRKAEGAPGRSTTPSAPKSSPAWSMNWK